MMSCYVILYNDAMQGPDEWHSMAHAALNSAGLRAGDAALHVGRHFSMRDVLKWCRRMQVLLLSSTVCVAVPASMLSFLGTSVLQSAWFSCILRLI